MDNIKYPTYSEIRKIIFTHFPYAEIEIDDDNELVIHTNAYLNDDNSIRDEFIPPVE